MSRKPIWIIAATAIVAVFFLSQFGYAGRGCKNKTGEAGYFPGQIISSGGLDREYILYVHPRYKHNRPTPLVFLFHGFTQTPENMLWYSNMAAFADAFKFILVVPKGIGFDETTLSWNAGSGFTPASMMGIDDVTFVADMIEEITEDYCVHPKRIFATGLSNGAALSYRLSCELSDLIAAIGPVAVADMSLVLDYVSCDPSRPVPVIAFNGTADPFIPWNGGAGFLTLFDPSILYPPVPEMIEALADRNGCSDKTKVVYQNGDVTCIAYEHCTDDATVKHCAIDGGGHNWPGAVDMCQIDPTTCGWAGHTTEDIDASREIWKFFAEHAMFGDD